MDRHGRFEFESNLEALQVPIEHSEVNRPTFGKVIERAGPDIMEYGVRLEYT